jgi:hypothetical protein
MPASEIFAVTKYPYRILYILFPLEVRENNTTMVALKIMPGYECFPIWITGKQGFFENSDPDQLPISDSLKKSLNQFRAQYDQTLDQSYPPDGGFPSQKDAIEFEQLGLSIWKKLLEEVGNRYEIVYFSVLEMKLYTDIQQIPHH